MTELERQVIDRFLAGRHPVLEILRAQISTARIRGREITETGFFTDLWIDEHAPVVEPSDRFALDDVFGHVEGISASICFLLHVHRGRLRTLEGFVLDADWPSHPRLLRSWYVRPDPAQAGQLVECDERDLDFALRGVAPRDDPEGHFDAEGTSH
jgi:hypothetical protein